LTSTTARFYFIAPTETVRQRRRFFGFVVVSSRRSSSRLGLDRGWFVLLDVPKLRAAGIWGHVFARRIAAKTEGVTLTSALFLRHGGAGEVDADARGA
jgi:hypothetical protein